MHHAILETQTYHYSLVSRLSSGRMPGPPETGNKANYYYAGNARNIMCLIPRWGKKSPGTHTVWYAQNSGNLDTFIIIDSALP